MKKNKLKTAVDHDAVHVEAGQVETQVKNQNKDIRQSLEEQKSAHVLSEAEKVRLGVGKQRRLDASFYQGLAEYQDKVLFWWPESDMESQFRIGAQPVPRRTKGMIFPGLNDKVSNEWEFVETGENKDGSAEKTYLLFMDEKLYHKYKIQPNLDANAAIQRSLGNGESQTDGAVMPGVTGLQTYNPEVGSGKRGLTKEIKHNV